MLRKIKPTTSGQRGMSYESREMISSKKPLKRLTVSLKKTGGRDIFGHLSTRHIGGGAKRKYRLIDFGSIEKCKEAVVKTIEYDPNRNARIALIECSDQQLRYIIAPHQIKIGQKLQFGKDAKNDIGNRMQIKDIQNGVAIHNIELYPSSKAKLARSAGTSAKILSKDGDYANIKLPSSEVRRIHVNCYASIGQVSNIEHKDVVVGKAGRKRHMGIRPTVRGKAMHPDAHPHGGGEGVNPIGLKYPKTPWGKNAYGKITRKAKKVTSKFIVKSRKGKR